MRGAISKNRYVPRSMRGPRLNYKTSDMYSYLFIHLCIDKENTHGSLTVSLARLLANPVHTSAIIQNRK